jgi:protein-S-isoprenylcysteine O-methyltransferase Ste14
VPWHLVVFGDALVLIGFAIVFLVFRENTFTAAIIAVEANQKVVSSGPYAVVRHPMYAGALLGFTGTRLALGSWWGLLPAGLVMGVIVWRLLDEEKFLARNLPGYDEYWRKVGWRLLPGMW